MMNNYSNLNIFFATIVAVVFMTVSVASYAGQGEIDFLSDDFYEDDFNLTETRDPLEPLNRVAFTVNDYLYTWILDPVATSYSELFPTSIRECVSNFFNNLKEPVRFVNALLQGRFSDSGRAMSRLIINSTLGVYGFGDAATLEFDIKPIEATLGQTMASWGIGDGFYLVVPFYGPSTLRDITGTVVESFSMTPYYIWTEDIWILGSIYTGKELNRISFRLGEYEDLKKLTLDPYVALRNIYFQYRESIRKQDSLDIIE